MGIKLSTMNKAERKQKIWFIGEVSQDNISNLLKAYKPIEGTFQLGSTRHVDFPHSGKSVSFITIAFQYWRAK